MRTTTFRVAAVAAAAALTLAACGDDGGDAETTADSPAAAESEDLRQLIQRAPAFVQQLRIGEVDRAQFVAVPAPGPVRQTRM